MDACDVTIINDQVRRVVSVEKDDADKVMNITHQALRTWLDEELSIGPHADNPGANIAVPGRDGLAARQAIDGPVLRSHADPDIPFQGPAVGNNGDRGRYGGQIVTDAALDGQPPREIFRRGGFAFRKREDGAANPAGGPGVEFAAVGPDGAPTGAWTPFTSARSLPNQRAPLSMLAHGSTQHQLLQMAEELGRALGRVEDQVTEALLAPGDVGDGYPDGAPADLASMMRVAGVANPWLRPVPESFEDPGGLVFRGPDERAGRGRRAPLARPHARAGAAPRPRRGRGRGAQRRALRLGHLGARRHDRVPGQRLGRPQADRPRRHVRGHPLPRRRDAAHPLEPLRVRKRGHAAERLRERHGLGSRRRDPDPRLRPRDRGHLGRRRREPRGPDPAPGADLPGADRPRLEVLAVGPARPRHAVQRPRERRDGPGDRLLRRAGRRRPAGAPEAQRPRRVRGLHAPAAGPRRPTPGSSCSGSASRSPSSRAATRSSRRRGSTSPRPGGRTTPSPSIGSSPWTSGRWRSTKSLAESLQVVESWSLELNPGVDEFDALGLGEAWALDATKEVPESLQVSEAWDLVLNP